MINIHYIWQNFADNWSLLWNVMAIINNDFADPSKGKGCEVVAGWEMDAEIVRSFLPWQEFGKEQSTHCHIPESFISYIWALTVLIPKI